MARQRFDEATVEAPASGRAHVHTEATMRCAYCGDSAASATLATFGARCGPCYFAFLRARPTYPSVPPDAVPPGTPDGLRWAYRLQWRHQRGEQLTSLQIEAYQGVMQRRHAVMADVRGGKA